MSLFETDPRSAKESIVEALHIAFAPMVFQASRCLREYGILRACERGEGKTQDELVEITKLSVYGVRVLLEAGLGIGLLTCKGGRYKLTTTGWHILNDEMTIANMDFVHDICYRGMYSLDEAIANGTPAGLRVFGDWSTVYEAVQHLPPRAQTSWFAFDHHYSDGVYALVMPAVAKYHPASILDVGGNTGKFALQYLARDAQIRVGIADLPGVVTVAAATIQRHGFGDRVSFHPVDMLDAKQALPRGYGAIWMSQFLDCFSESEIVSILGRCRDAVDAGGPVFILEPFWNRQDREISAFCLQMTSLYFTAIANGNSQIYASGLFLELIARAGLEVVEQIDHIGLCHSLIVCRAS